MINITLMYAFEKFSFAVSSMALSTDSLHVRLARAWRNNLSVILMNDVTNLPAEIQSKLSELSKKLNAKADVAGPDITSLVNALDDDHVRDAIDEVNDLYYFIVQACALDSSAF